MNGAQGLDRRLASLGVPDDLSSPLFRMASMSYNMDSRARRERC